MKRTRALDDHVRHELDHARPFQAGSGSTPNGRPIGRTLPERTSRTAGIAQWRKALSLTGKGEARDTIANVASVLRTE